MARKIIDTYPRFTISVGPKPTQRTMTWADANEAKAEFAELIDGLKAATLRDFVVEVELVEEARCEFCNYTWTAAGTDFNDECCDRDAANDPERLLALRKLADEIDGETFYRFEDGKRERTAISWPNSLANAVSAWLDVGRSADTVPALLRCAQHVKSSDWCTVWEDPGPDGCSLQRLPDRVTQDGRPEGLADDLLSLIDDMGLLPARSAA